MGSPMGGSPPTGFLEGRERLGGLKARYAGLGLVTQKGPEPANLWVKVWPPRATGLSSFFSTDIMRHLLEEEGNDFPRNVCKDALEGVSGMRQMTSLKVICA